MTEIAQTYLGNIHENRHLAELVGIETCLEVCLNQSDRSKGRIHAHTDNNITVGIIKSRDRFLHAGDVFRTESKKLLLIHLQKQELLIIDLSDLPDSFAAKDLVYLGHVLGNHHYPITIQNNKIYVQITTEPEIIEKIIKNTQIPGLKIKYDARDAVEDVAFLSHSH